MDEKKKEPPKCDLRWDEDHFIVECATTEDRDRAAKAFEEMEVIVRVKVKKEGEGIK